MTRPAAVALALLALSALAGTRFAQTSGGVPTASTDGVSLVGVTACRGSVRYTDGGSVAGGKLIPMYYDTVLGWTEAKTTDQCNLSTDTLADGGARRTQLCEFVVAAQFGRAALVSTGLTPQVSGIVRLECWGPDLPTLDGGAR